MRRHHLRRRWTERLAALIPGLGALLAGRSVVGFLQLFGAACLFALVGLRSAVAIHAWHVPGDGSGGRVVLVVAACGVLILSVFSVHRAFAR